MSDITCAHCGEPWDVYGLREDGIGYLEDSQADMLAPLEPVSATVDYLAGQGSDLREVLAGAPGLAQPYTLATLFTWYWTTADPDSPEADAAKRVVNTAIYNAVKAQRGCTRCGFAHTTTGKHAETTQRQLVDGVDDLDPTQFLT